MPYYITIDIGGTHLRAALFKSSATCPEKHQRVRTHTLDGQSVFERLAQQVEAIWPSGGDVAAIAVASPGPLDPMTGVIFATPNIPEWVDFPLGESLSRRFGVPVFVENDANLAGLGEWKYGAGRGHHHVLYLTVSTGIGGGVIINDRLLQGAYGLAAELGHVVVSPEGPVCSCGKPGHLEAFAAGPGIVRYVRERLESGVQSVLQADANLSARDVAEAAKNGDPLGLEAMARAGEYLGIGLANFLHIFNPSIVIFGGGVSQSGDCLFGPMQRSLRERVFRRNYLDNLTITMAELGDDAGLMGALAWASINYPV
jgi:glucokinase